MAYRKDNRSNTVLGINTDKAIKYLSLIVAATVPLTFVMDDEIKDFDKLKATMGLIAFLIFIAS
jgi:hypothetical protein